MAVNHLYHYASWELDVGRQVAEYSQPYTSRIHMHHFYTIYYCISGSMTIRIQQSLYSLKPGDLFIASSGEPYVISAFPGERRDCLLITFERDWLESLHMERLLFPFESREHGEDNLFRPADSADEYWSQILKHLVRETAPGELEAKTCTLSLLWCILEQFSTTLPSFSTDEDLSKQILRYVNSNFLKEISMEAITEQFHISRASLYRLFKAESGLPIGEYVTKKRLLAAREMLISGVSPKKVSTYCCFNDYSTFYRAYKRQFGVSPSGEPKVGP